MSDVPSTPAATPDAPPNADIPAPLTEAMFTAKQIAVVTLLATPIGGALLASMNAKALGKSDGARAAIVVVGGALTAAIFAVDVWGAGAFSFAALPIAAMAAYGLFSATRADRGGDHAARSQRSHLIPAIVVVVCWLALGVTGTLVGAFSFMHAPSADEMLGDSVEFSSGERVHFVDGARREDADEVARALAAGGYFTGTGSLRLSVDRINDGNDLRVTLHVPHDATVADVEAGRAMLKSVAQHLAPPRCVQGRLRTPGGAEKANGRLCP